MTRSRRHVRPRRLVVAWLCAVFSTAWAAADPTKIRFALPEGDATVTLRQFSQQARTPIVYPVDAVRGVKTNPVQGEFTARAALDRMVAGTALIVSQDAVTGALTVGRAARPPAPGPRSTSPPSLSADESPAPMKSRSLLATVLGLFAADPATAQPAAGTARPAAAESEVISLDAFTVTGSNLRAGESVGGANLRVVTAAEIEQAGTGSLFTFMKKIPEAGANGFGENRVNTSSPGTASVSLRGLGANSTLVLLNGRRLAPAPFAQGGSAAGLGTIQFVDLNMIPVDAIARVEVLKDGASAVYGADAVAGVVNLILKDNAQGATARAFYGDFPGGIAANTVKGSFYTGAKVGKTKLFLLANYLHQAKIQYGELSHKVTALSSGSNPGTFVVPVGATNPITGQVIAPGTPAAARTFTVDTSATPTQARFNTTTATAAQNRFDINEALTPQPRVTRWGALATLAYEISATTTGYAEWNYQKNKNFEHLSASPITNLNTVTLPANNPFNPFGVTVTNDPVVGATLIYRFTEAGPRVTETTNDFQRFVAGVKGKAGQTWAWDASALYNRATSHNALPSGWLSQAAVNAALADTNRATSLNLFTNAAVTNSAATLEKLKSSATRDAFTELNAIGAKGTGSVFSLPAGMVNLATGVEWREERFRDKRTPDHLLNQSTPVPQSKGSRRVAAAFAEFSAPLLGAAQKIPALALVELNAAGRAERYSDAGFTNTAVPKVGLRWQPVDAQVTLRVSWGKGYRAPSLAELYQPQSTSISFSIADPLRAGRPGSNVNDTSAGQRQLVSGGNPLLRPEKSESWNYGLLFQPKFAAGLSLSLDYYKVDVRDRIGAPATPAIILANPALFPGFADRAAPTASDTANNLPGELIRVRTVTGNYGTAATSGLDLGAEYRFATQRLGKFTARVAGSTVYHAAIRTLPYLAAVETVATYEVPRIRGNASLAWSHGKFGAVLTGDYIHGYADSAPSLTRVKQQTIAGLQLSRDLPAATKLTLGVNNLFDRDTPRTAASTGYAGSTNYFLPRFLYVDIIKKF